MFQGDADVDYQFEIYRMMRNLNKLVVLNSYSILIDNLRDDWKSYHPKSNVFWLDYLLSKLIDFKKYGTRKMRAADKRLANTVRDGLLDYSKLLIDCIYRYIHLRFVCRCCHIVQKVPQMDTTSYILNLFVLSIKLNVA